MTTTARLQAISTEFVHVPVTTDQDLSGSPVSLAFLAGEQEPADLDWLPGAWRDGDTSPWLARVLVGPEGGAVTLTAGAYAVWIRILDSTETPIRRAGTLKVV